MCARRFLIAIFILTLLVAAGAFAIFQFGQQILLRTEATPKGHYTPPADRRLDYSDAASWIARPGMSPNPAEWLPDGAPSPAATGSAAIFYIHPTTYLQNDRWNAPTNDTVGRQKAVLFVQTQASALAPAGQVWAPRYRQAAYGAFLLNSKDAQAALNLAYADVLRAFDRFIVESAGRPIILAGHSQGALHLLRLLKERVANSALKQRLIAAYVVGWPISAKADLPALALPACGSPEQTGCILSWMSFGEPANPNLVLRTYEGSAGFAGVKRSREDMVCVNPLTGTQDGAAPASANPGTLVPAANLSSATLAPGLVGARCEKGLLFIDGDIPPLGPYVLPGNNYHVYDYALFWGAIREDARRRAEAFAKR
ncbi:MAG: DUF3089 domain-containing protein [Sphingomicrobium sp.]